MACTLCGIRESKEGRKRCHDCAARVAAQQWRWKQGQPKKARPTRQVSLDTASDPLILSHVPLAKKYARRVVLKHRVSDGEDVLGDALYGLVVAGRTFNASKGVPFAAWAIREMRGVVYNALQKQWRQGKASEAA